MEMKNNQSQSVSHLSRGEFEVYLDSLDRIGSILPSNIGDYRLHEMSINGQSTGYIFYFNGVKKLHGEPEEDHDDHTYVQKDTVRKMLLRLYDNGYLPQYSEKLDS